LPGDLRGPVPKPAPPSDHIPLRRRCAFGNHPQVHLCTFLPGTKFKFPRDLIGRVFQSESAMAGLYLGIAVAGVNALIATGLVIVLM
jgi:hypothetical protein